MHVTNECLIKQFKSRGCSKKFIIELQNIEMGCDQSFLSQAPGQINFQKCSALDYASTAQNGAQIYSNTEVENGRFFDCIIPLFDDITKNEGAKVYFYESLSQKIGELYTVVIGAMERSTINQTLEDDEMRVRFSKTILLNVLNLLKELQKRYNWKKEGLHVFKAVSRAQQKIIEFLKFKYPRNKKNFIPTDLIDIFHELNDSEHTDYDLLINSKTTFDNYSVRDYGKSAIIKRIKEFLNKLIKETNRFYDCFRQQMEGTFQGIEGTFKIGRKISENVSIFTDISSENLQINSPQIFRIIIKWITCLQDVFQKPEEKLKATKYFKILEEEEDDDFNLQHSYFPIHTGNAELVRMLSSLLESSVGSYNSQEEEHQIALANFNDTLIKVLSKKTDTPEIKQEQVKTIKFAYNTGKFIEFLATEKLVHMISQLVAVRAKAEKKSRKAVDLIRCQVMDLLRSQFMGKKAQIIQVFEKMKKMEKQKKIKIIRIKNRFSTPLNDCLVNFMFTGNKNSFLVCEIQLVLQDNTEIHPREKAREQFNHILYEVERSIFTPTAELALLLAYNDTLVGFEKKVALEKSEMENLRCPDNQVLSCQSDLSVPYICSFCAKFYPVNQNPFPVHRCVNCNFYACPSCLFQFDPLTRDACYRKELGDYLKEFVCQVDEQIESGMFCFSENYFTVASMGKRRNMLDALQEKMREAQVDYAFVLKFKDGKKHLQGFTIRSGYIIPVFYDFLPRSARKQYRTQQFGPYDIILFLNPAFKIQTFPQEQQSKQPLKTLIGSFKLEKRVKETIQYKWQGVSYILDVGEQIRQNQNQKPLVSYGSVSSFQQTSTTRRGGASEFQKALANYRDIEGRLELDYLDICELTVTTLKQVNQAQLRFVQIKSNRLKSIDSLLNSFTNLQEIDASRNQIVCVAIKKPLEKMRMIDISENFIQKMEGFREQNLPVLKNLEIDHNSISEFPLLKLPLLIWLNLSFNKLSCMTNFAHSSLPKIRKLSLSNNQIVNIPDSSLPCLLELELDYNRITNIDFINKFQRMECVSLIYNNISKLLELQNLQTLKLKNNQINQLTQFSRSELPKLMSLDLSNNSIKSVPQLNFDELLHLNLSHNELKEITNISQTQYLHNLQQLDLSQNKLTRFQKLSLEELEFLNLSGNKINFIQAFEESFLPSLEQIDLSKNQISEVPSLKNMKSLKFLNISSNEISSIKVFMEESILPKLIVLFLSHNKIKEFYAGSFPALEEIKISNNCLQTIHEIKQGQLSACRNLDFSFNKIKSFPRLFIPKLEKLLLHHNQMTELQKLKQANLPNLQVLDLAHNKVICFPSIIMPELLQLNLMGNELLSTGGLEDSTLPQLEDINLSANKLQELGKLSLPKLMTVNISSNALEDISALENWKTPEINAINLSKNKIKELCPLRSAGLTTLTLSSNLLISISNFCAGSDLPKLLTLTINKNSLSGPLPVMRFESLKTLKLILNDLSSLEQFSLKSSLPKLEILKVSFNKIKELPQFSSKSLQKLKVLQAMNNQISDIENLSFSDLDKLRQLNLQQNSILALPKLAFKNLTTLNLDSNAINDVQQFERSELPNLEALSLRNNKIAQWPEELYMQKLKKLNLAENMIDDPKHICSRNYPELVELNLRKNKVSQLKSVKLPKLMSLLLENNALRGNEAQVLLALKEKNSHISDKLRVGITGENKQIRKSRQEKFNDIENKENLSVMTA